MSFILSERRGMFGGEARRESFVIHPADDEEAYRRWGREPHPEFEWTDLDDLIAMLVLLRGHAEAHGIRTGRDEVEVGDADGS